MILYNGWESAPAAAEADRLEGDVRKASHGRSSYSNGESTMWPNRVSRSAAGRRALPPAPERFSSELIALRRSPALPPSLSAIGRLFAYRLAAGPSAHGFWFDA